MGTSSKGIWGMAKKNGRPGRPEKDARMKHEMEGPETTRQRGAEEWPPSLFEEVTDLLADALVEDTTTYPELYPSLWKTRTDREGLTRLSGPG